MAFIHTMRCAALVLLALSTLFAADPLLSFPGAVGYGAFVSDGTVHGVTTTNDAEPESPQATLQASAPRSVRIRIEHTNGTTYAVEAEQAGIVIPGQLVEGHYHFDDLSQQLDTLIRPCIGGDTDNDEADGDGGDDGAGGDDGDGGDDGVAPTTLGALNDVTLSEGAAIHPIDVTVDFSGSEPITYALAPTSDPLPTGLSLSIEGALTGTPSEIVAGLNIVVRGTNDFGSADTAFMLTVEKSASWTILPLMTKGYGAETSGGAGGRVVLVTNTATDTSAGSLRWALDQHPGEPIVIIPVVEGGFNYGSVLTITRANITFEGRFAPGAGFWVTGPRWRILASNMRFHHWMHLGNSPHDTPDARCWSFGSYDSNTSSDTVIKNIVLMNVLATNNRRTGTISFNPRTLDQSSVETVRDISIVRSIMARPNKYESSDSANLIFIGDGVDGLTLAGNLLSSGRNRHPAVRAHNQRIEIVNNVIYNWGNSAVDLWSAENRTHVLNNVFKPGPFTGSAANRILVAVQENGRITFAGNETPDAFDGSFQGASAAGWSTTTDLQFTASNWTMTPADEVVDDVVVFAGPHGPGGLRRPLAQAFIDEMVTNTGISTIATYPGPTQAETGEPFPAHANYVPDDYAAIFPSDSDLEAVISDGSAWNGRQVWERVAAWLVDGSRTDNT